MNKMCSLKQWVMVKPLVKTLVIENAESNFYLFNILCENLPSLQRISLVFRLSKMPSSLERLLKNCPRDFCDKVTSVELHDVRVIFCSAGKSKNQLSNSGGEHVQPSRETFMLLFDTFVNLKSLKIDPMWDALDVLKSADKEAILSACIQKNIQIQLKQSFIFFDRLPGHLSEDMRGLISSISIVRRSALFLRLARETINSLVNVNSLKFIGWDSKESYLRQNPIYLSFQLVDSVCSNLRHLEMFGVVFPHQIGQEEFPRVENLKFVCCWFQRGSFAALLSTFPGAKEVSLENTFFENSNQGINKNKSLEKVSIKFKFRSRFLDRIDPKLQWQSCLGYIQTCCPLVHFLDTSVPELASSSLLKKVLEPFNSTLLFRIRFNFSSGTDHRTIKRLSRILRSSLSSVPFVHFRRFAPFGRDDFCSIDPSSEFYDEIISEDEIEISDQHLKMLMDETEQQVEDKIEEYEENSVSSDDWGSDDSNHEIDFLPWHWMMFSEFLRVMNDDREDDDDDDEEEDE